MTFFARPFVLLFTVLLIAISGPASAIAIGVKLSGSVFWNTGNAETSHLYKVQSGNLFSYSIDLGVWRKREDALRHIDDMKRNHPVLSKYKFYVKQLDFNHWGTGVVHRIRIGYMKTKKEADIVCGNLLEDGYQKKCETQFDPG